MSSEPSPANSRSSTPDLDPSDDTLDTGLDIDLTEISLSDQPSDRALLLKAGPSKTADAEGELERFRNAWKQELKSNQITKAEHVGAEKGKEKEREQNIPRESGSLQSGLASITGSPEATRRQLDRSPVRTTKIMPKDEDEDDDNIPGLLGNMQHPSSSKRTLQFPVQQVGGDQKEQAIALYARAVEHEQAGKLNEALMMYRKAFKLEDDVDRLYARSIAAAAQTATESIPETPTSTDVVSSAAPIEEPYSFQRYMQVQPDYETPHPLTAIHDPTPTTSKTSPLNLGRLSPLTTLMSRLPIPADQIMFLPADENLPLPLAKLPLELLDPIISYLDVAAIERFALICWRARYVTSRAPKWKRVVESLYKPPGILALGKSVKDLDVMGKYSGEWRTALMEEERIRMDGCYISVCHYIRPGAGDQWVTVTHMITYHRFLRFYPDGTVISFLTTDHPSEVVPLLRPTIRGKGLHFGHWRLIRSDSPENITSPTIPQIEIDGTNTRSKSTTTKDGKRRARIVITDLMEPGTEVPKYEFEMDLALRETGRGRWNKLDMLNYQSINLATGEALGLSLKHQKPFYFSKVKSYHPHL